MKDSDAGKERVCIFARPPVLGRVKTRLAAALGDARALELYLGFLEGVIDAAGGCRGEVVLHLSEPLPDDPAVPLRDRLERLPIRVQVEGDLGARMAGAFAREAAAGARIVAIVGSDLPDLRAEDLDACLEAARRHPGALVLAPTPDGGFWCVAGPADLGWEALFEGIEWSSGRERAQVEARARAAGRAVVAGPRLQDVDEARDLPRHLQ